MYGLSVTFAARLPPPCQSESSTDATGHLSREPRLWAVAAVLPHRRRVRPADRRRTSPGGVSSRHG